MLYLESNLPSPVGVRSNDKNKEEFPTITYKQGKYMLDVFSEDGTPVVRYTMDKCMHIFTVDEKGGWVVGYNYTDEDHLLRFRFPNRQEDGETSPI